MRAFTVTLAILTALAAGVYIGANPNTPVVGVLQDVIAPDKAEIPSDRARELIRNEYIHEVPEQTLTDGEISGMVRSLKDPYSLYFNAKQKRVFDESLSGKYSGVGMGVIEDKQKRGLRVTSVYDESPARAAGIRPGDLITEVNGKSLAGVDSKTAVAKITGPEGTFVTLTFRSSLDDEGKDLGSPREKRLRRKQIDIPVTTGRLIKRNGRKTGVIQLAQFVDTAGAAVTKEVEKLEKKDADSYVLDLRGNGGGSIDQAVAVSSIFLSKGMVVATDGRGRLRRQYDVDKNALRTADPLVVLVDGGTASSSEIVTGALKYRDRALVVGTRTFGKGVFQEVTQFEGGGALSLTVGRYELPGKHYVTKHGLRPDLEARDRHKTRADEALDAALAALAAFKK